MKTTIITLAAAAAAALAAPAAAQTGTYNQGAYNQGAYNRGGAVGLDNRIAQLDARLQAGIANGAIDRNEARSLRQQVRQINRLYGQYSANGLTQQERRDLQQRIRTTRQNLRAADNDQRYANWNDESYYGNWNDDVYGGYDPNQRPGYGQQGYGSQGSAYRQTNQVCAQNRNAISSILGAMLGSDNCLRVGERVTTGLAAVPNEYRNRFPSRSGHRYGWLENSIVEYDSRTGLVTSIYDAR